MTGRFWYQRTASSLSRATPSPSRYIVPYNIFCVGITLIRSFAKPPVCHFIILWNSVGPLICQAQLELSYDIPGLGLCL